MPGTRVPESPRLQEVPRPRNPPRKLGPLKGFRSPESSGNPRTIAEPSEIPWGPNSLGTHKKPENPKEARSAEASEFIGKAPRIPRKPPYSEDSDPSKMPKHQIGPWTTGNSKDPRTT